MLRLLLLVVLLLLMLLLLTSGRESAAVELQSRSHMSNHILTAPTRT